MTMTLNIYKDEYKASHLGYLREAFTVESETPKVITISGTQTDLERAMMGMYTNDELFLICGSDTIDAVPNWKKFETDIKDNVGFIEVKRDDGTEIDNPTRPFIIHEGSRSSYTTKGFWYVKMQRMDASSTLVRSMISKGMNP